MKITSVKCVTFSSVNSFGTPWDANDNPDCFLRLKDSWGTIMYQTDYTPDVAGELNWIINPVVTITDLSSFVLELRDYDNDYTDTGSELIVSDNVIISDYTSSLGTVNKEETGNYPDVIEVSEAGATFQISVNWE
mgnify:CR=1 FL=1